MRDNEVLIAIAGSIIGLFIIIKFWKSFLGLAIAIGTGLVIYYLTQGGGGKVLFPEKDQYETIQKQCNSINYSRTECLIQGRIQNVHLQRQLSNSPCIQGQSFGYYYNQIWVDKGCRAIFIISVITN